MSQDAAEAGTTTTSRGRGRGTAIALVVANAFSLLLLAGTFLVPVYETTSTSSDGGTTTTGSATLVDENGAGVVLVLTLPLLVSLLVSLLLLRAPRRVGLPLAWTLTGLFAALNLLAILTVGIFVLPVTISLIVACVLRSRTA